MKVFVSGSSSNLAQALLPRLCAQASITAVTGIDLRPPRYTHPRFAAYQLDLRDHALQPLLKNHGAMIHLAFVVLRGKMDAAAMSDTNVSGSHELFRAARHAGLRRLIHVSSAAVYGSGANLAETAAYHPLPGFLYGQHKAQLEQLLATEFPDCIRLRPHVILGPHAQPTLRQILRLPLILRLPDPQPEFQCVHEDDVATAIMASLTRPARGAYNIAATDTWTLRDVMRDRHSLTLPLSAAVARAGLTAAHRICGWGGEPGWLNGLFHTLTLDCRRAAQDLDWRPVHSSTQALATTG